MYDLSHCLERICQKSPWKKKNLDRLLTAIAAVTQIND